MDATAAAAQAALTAPSDDPFLTFLKWAVVILLVMLLGAKPLMEYIRQRSSDGAERSKDNAEVTLYTHLAEQVREYRTLADKAIDERNTLLIRVTELEYRVERFAELQTRFAGIQQRIEQKDETIALLIQQGNDERRRFMELLEAKDERYAALEASHRALEIRVTKDEARMDFVCPMTPAGEQV